MSYAYDGATWREISEFWAYDGATWRDIQEAWSYDGSVWRLVHEVSSCVCGTTAITLDLDRDYDPSPCTCQTTPKVIQQGRFCVAWNYTLGTGTLACVKAQIQYNVSGGAYTSVFTLYELNTPSSTWADCTGTTYNGYYSPNRCTNDNRNYRVRAVLTDLTVCSTGTGTGTRNCIS